MNVLRQTVKVIVEVDDEKEIHEFLVKELKFNPMKRKEKKENHKENNSEQEKELAELEGKERREGKSKLNDDRA